MEGDALPESFWMSGSVTCTAFPGKEQDVHKHGGVREQGRGKAGRAQEPQRLKSAAAS